MTAPNKNLGGTMTPTEAQPVSGTAPGVAPTLPTIVSVQGVVGGTSLPVSATIPGTVDVSDRIGRLLGIANLDHRIPYDAQLVSAPAPGVQAVVTFPATANQRWIIDIITGSVFTSGLAASPAIVVIDDPGGVGALIWAYQLSVQAVGGAIDTIASPTLMGVTGSIGKAVSVGFNVAGGAGVAEVVSAAGYLIT